MVLLASITVAFVPVLVFLGVLVVMDSFKLARPSAIAAAIGWGVLAAVLSGVAQGSLALASASRPSIDSSRQRSKRRSSPHSSPT